MTNNKKYLENENFDFCLYAVNLWFTNIMNHFWFKMKFTIILVQDWLTFSIHASWNVIPQYSVFFFFAVDESNLLESRVASLLLKITFWRSCVSDTLPIFCLLLAVNSWGLLHRMHAFSDLFFGLLFYSVHFSYIHYWSCDFASVNFI